MSRQKAHHTKQFKLDAVNYCREHPDLTQVECAKNLGIGVSTLARWEAQHEVLCGCTAPVSCTHNVRL